MKKYSTKDLPQILDRLGIVEGDTLIVHNSLIRFGIPNDVRISDVPSKIFESIITKLGTEGTLCVPVFNFDFCSGKPFDRLETPSQNMGIFSEYVRKHPASERSYHAMQSIAAVGKNAKHIVEKDTKSAFAVDGPFDRMRKLNGKIVLLGADFNTVSMIHLLEERHSVPYRIWKTFSGLCIENGKSLEKSYDLYARSLDINPKLKLYAIEEELRNRNQLMEAELGGGLIKIFNISDFFHIANYCLSNNPYYFVSNNRSFEKIF